MRSGTASPARRRSPATERGAAAAPSAKLDLQETMDPDEHRTGGAAYEGTVSPLTETEPRRVRLEERGGAVVLLSGGLDSATVLAIARAQGVDCYALTVDYGQRHHAELAAARRTALYLGASAHRVIAVDLRVFGGSALTGSQPVPHPRSADEIGSRIPSTYVPARNTILLSLALAWAEVLDVVDIFIGANARDYSGYPDCRPEYIEAFERLANLATRAGTEGGREFRVHAPVIHMSKAQIIAKGMELGVNFALTHSCYDPAPDGRACGICDACILRRQGFQQAGVDDPTAYVRNH
jgi:7-cyano-7-deazaguanine synthase